MTVRTLTLKSALLYILSHIRYTASRLQVNPATAPYAATFQALRNEWSAIQATEVEILEELSDAQALVDEADEGLDGFASRLSKAVLVLTNDNRKASLYTHFFGKKAVSALVKPSLGAQLKAMKAWIPSLVGSTYPTLQAMAPELTQLVAAADNAISARDDAKQKNRQFRDVGARAQFIDKLNAARKETYGVLAKMPFADPTLPADFADRFFRTDADEAVTIKSVTEDIGSLEGQLADAKTLLGKLEAEAKAEADAAAQEKADEEALAALEKQEEDLEKQKAELKAKLGKK